MAQLVRPAYLMNSSSMVTAAAGTPSAAITSFEIVNGTKLDATGFDGDATTRNGVNCEGWVAKITLPYLAATTPDPTKISISVTESNANGGLTRTVVGTQLLRRQYTAGDPGPTVSSTNTKRVRSNDGITEVYYITLSSRIYAGSTINSVTASTGYYSTAQAGPVTSVTNSSTLSYWTPGSVWLNKQQERLTATTRIRLYVASAYAAFSQAVPKVVFKVKNGASVLDTYTVTTPTLSQIQTSGNIVEVFAFDLSLTNVPQSALDTDMYTVDAEIYSWFGASPYVLSTSGVAWPTQNTQTPLRFMCDKNGTYGGAHVAVQIGYAGANGASTVAGDYATAVSRPYTTWVAATQALAAWNSGAGGKGHNTHHGATIWMMETTSGSGATHSIATTTAAAHTTDGCWSVTKVDPAATGTVNMTCTANATLTNLFDFDIDMIMNGGGILGSTSNFRMISYKKQVIQTQNGQSQNRMALSYYTNVTFPTATNGFRGFGGNSTDKMVAILIGCTATANTTASNIFPTAMLGCNVANVTVIDWNSPQDDLSGRIFANNKFLHMQAQMQLGDTVAIGSRGTFCVQNVVERAGGGTSLLCLSVSENALSLDNLVWQQNTIPGTDNAARVAFVYTWITGSYNLTKRVPSFKNNITYSHTMGKQDTRRDPNTVPSPWDIDRVDNWAVNYHVDCYNNVAVNGSSGDFVADPDGVNFVGTYVHPSEKWNNPSVTYVSNLSGGAAAGFGDYRLRGVTNDAWNTVGANDNCTKYGLLGNVRLTDGTEAAGAISKAA